ncbi:MAG: DUF6062 family protein, partial [Anaerolineae bacterium]|nr:DUF6062 family protein [Anaerolineae bacterium]
MAKRQPSKHTTFHEVLDALQQEGCPVCRLGLRAVSRHLDVLSYEGVNDPGARAELRRARGFCHAHAWQFARDVRDGLGTAIIYRDVLNALLPLLWERRIGSLGKLRRSAAQLSEVETGQAAGSNLGRRLLPQGECPACRTLRRSSQRYLETLLLHLADAEVRRRYRASGGLCRQHLALALPRLQPGVDLDLLLEVFAGRVGGLAGRVATPGLLPMLVEAL